MTGDLDGLRKDLNAARSSRAINVLTALSHLAHRDDRFKDIEAAYHMLSDFAHPNMASHATVIEMPSAPRDKHVCQLAAAPGALRGEFVAVISLPWISMGIGTMVELLLEVAPLLERWLGYVDDRVTIRIDFAK